MIKLSPSQLRVVEEFPDFLSDTSNNEMTISGFAGSGKTFLVKYLAEKAEKQQALLNMVDSDLPRRTFYFTATTNKAAAVLEETVGKDKNVRTIHKLLGLVVQNDYTTGKQILVRKDRVASLRNSVIFIDEASMIHFDLLDAIRKSQDAAYDCKLVFIGDKYQLPPVKEDVCPVFDPNAANVFFLDEIQRQAADSPIIQLSAEYRGNLDNHERDWPEIPHDGKAIFHYLDRKAFFSETKAAFLRPHKPTDCKILAWSNKRVHGYNKWIRKHQGYTEPFVIGEDLVTNKPLVHDGLIMASTDTVHRVTQVSRAVGGRVAGVWICLAGFGTTQFFQPLHWGHATNLMKQLAEEAKLSGDWSPYFEVKDTWADLRPIHASTVHKAQGSTYREVFIDLENIGENKHWREVARLVYVAVSRASERVHLFGNLCLNYNKEPLENLMEGFADVQPS